MRIALFAVTLVLATFAGCASDVEPDRARELEHRLLAPCCWRQSLAEHDSPLATTLRAEIESRLQDGASPQAIEHSFVERYGPRVLALGPGRDPRWLIGVLLGAAVAGGALVLVVVGRRKPPLSTRSTPVEGDTAYEERLEDELAYVD